MMRSAAAKAVWSLASGVTGLVASLIVLGIAYFLYWQAFDRIGLTAAERYSNVPGQLSGSESAFFRATYSFLMLGACAGTIAFSTWLAKRRGGWVPATIACTIVLVGLALFPLLLLTTIANCPFIESFPLPDYNCGG
jgi:hypothetical protein